MGDEIGWWDPTRGSLQHEEERNRAREMEQAELYRILLGLRTGRWAVLNLAKSHWLRKHPDKQIVLDNVEYTAITGRKELGPIEGANLQGIDEQDLWALDISKLIFTNPTLSNEAAVRLLESKGARVMDYTINGMRYSNAAAPVITVVKPAKSAQEPTTPSEKPAEPALDREAKRAAADAEAAAINASSRNAQRSYRDNVAGRVQSGRSLKGRW